MLHHHATVVVLEENAAAQDLIDQALRELGHHVLITNNPMEIVAVARRVQVDVLVGDVGLLDSTEPKLAEKLRSVAPVVSLSAPFRLEALHEAVAEALRGPNAA
jgi:CheY-like chemotaxis protein